MFWVSTGRDGDSKVSATHQGCSVNADHREQQGTNSGVECSITAEAIRTYWLGLVFWVVPVSAQLLVLLSLSVPHLHLYQCRC